MSVDVNGERFAQEKPHVGDGQKTAVKMRSTTKLPTVVKCIFVI